MEYTVQKLAKLSGVTSRTLRYYDEIDLLKPARINSSGYRIYGEVEVKKLQQILFYREFNFPLDVIKGIINSPDFDKASALNEHHKKLLLQRQRLDLLINNIENTIQEWKGDFKMSDKERFDGFKRKSIDENERKYGKEIREKYGNKVIDDSYKKFGNMTEEQYSKFTNLSEEINSLLKEAVKTNDPAGELGQKVAKLHKDWLSFTWPFYTPEAHAGLAQSYVDDERFKAYYEKIAVGAAEFLRDAIVIFTNA